MTILKEMINRKEIEEISWIPTDANIADSLRKKGVLSFKIFGFYIRVQEVLNLMNLHFLGSFFPPEKHDTHLKGKKKMRVENC